MIGPDSHVHPCSLFVWGWLSDGGCALPHRGHYPVLVSAGLHLGGQRDSDMSTWWEAADGWTPTSLSRWVSVSLVYVIVFLCVFIMVCCCHGLAMCAHWISVQFGLLHSNALTFPLHSNHIEWFSVSLISANMAAWLISITIPPRDGLSGMKHMKIILCGTPKTPAVTLAAFSSHQNTDNFTLGGYTQLPLSFVKRSWVDENFVFPELWDRVVLGSLSQRDRYQTQPVPSFIKDLRCSDVEYILSVFTIMWLDIVVTHFFQQKHFCKEQLLWLFFHKFGLWYGVRWKRRLKFHGLLHWICLEYGTFQS